MKILITSIILFLLIISFNSFAGSYKYTTDVQNEKYDKEWDSLRSHIGEVYLINPMSSIKPRFYESPYSLKNEFIITEKEYFTILDGFVNCFDNTYWLSLSEKRPKIMTMRYCSVNYEVLFASGKMGYYHHSSYEWPPRMYGITFVSKLPDDKVNEIMSLAKDKRLDEIESIKKLQAKEKEKKKKKKVVSDKVETKTETRLEMK